MKSMDLQVAGESLGLVEPMGRIAKPAMALLAIAGLTLTLSAKPIDPYGPRNCDEGGGGPIGGGEPGGGPDAGSPSAICGSGTEAQAGDGGKDLSDPINIATGDYQLQQTDLFIPGRGMDFQLSRYYRSRSGFWTIAHFDESAEFCPLGMNWDHSYSIKVDVNGGSTAAPAGLELMTGTGRIDDYFRRPSLDDGVWDAYTNPEHTGILYYNPTDYTSKYVTPSNMVYLFEANPNTGEPALLDSITDRNQNVIDCVNETIVDANGVSRKRLDRVVDTLGNVIEFTYHGSHNGQGTGLHPASSFNALQPGALNRISIRLDHLLFRVEDHAGRTVEYEYDVHDWRGTGQDQKLRLTDVTLPAVISTSDFPLPSEHQRFPIGRRWQFEYDTANDTSTTLPNPLIWWGGQLSKITDPNGNVVLENEYTNPIYDPGFRDDYRLAKQTYGNGVFNYWLSGPPGFNDDYSIYVNDRRGYVTRLDYAGASNSVGHRRLLERHELIFPASSDNQQSLPTDMQAIVTEYRHDDSVSNYNDWAIRRRVAPQKAGEQVNGLVDERDVVEARYFVDDWVAAQNPIADIDPRRAQAMTYRRRAASASETVDSSNPENDGVIEERWAYNFQFGSCCGSDFATAYQDGRGFLTFYEYDDKGNLTARASGVDPQTPGLTGIVIGGVTITDPINAVYDRVNEPSLATTIENAAASVEEWTYNTDGQVTSHTHPATTVWNSGTPDSSFTRVDTYSYYPSGPMEGRLKQVVVDDDQSGHVGLKLTTSFLYDKVGNVVQVTEPDDDYSVNTFNQAGQVVRTQRYASGGGAVLAQTDSYFDANGNVVRRDVLDLDEALIAQGSITTLYDYDELNDVVRTAQEKGDINVPNGLGVGVFSAVGYVEDPDWVVSEYGYDKARNLVLVRDGEATNGNQASNQTAHEYDARDLLIKRYEGGSGVDGKTNPLRVVSYTYDEKGRRTEETVLGDPLLIGNGIADRTTVTAYDDLDRIESITDPMGNTTRFVYDDNGNRRMVAHCGAIGHDALAAGVSGDSEGLLSYAEYAYDALNRRIESKVGIFDLVAGNPIACPSFPPPVGLITYATVDTAYNADSSVKWVDVPATDPLMINPGRTESFYDTAGRLVVTRDADGNLVQYAYDSASNIIEEVTVDQGPGTSSETYRTIHVYDALDRRVTTVEGVYGPSAPFGPQNTTSFGYDSRGNRVSVIDPNGNVTRFEYDGLSRQVLTRQLMADGVVSADDIVTRTVYDDESRVIELLDDNQLDPPQGEPVLGTRYGYDGLGRETTRTFPDGTVHTTQYDTVGNPFLVTDARGVELDQSFDLSNRMTQRLIIKPLDGLGNPIIEGADSETFQYDGLGRVTYAENNFSVVSRSYDSRGNMVSETLNADSDNAFPTGSDRIVAYEYDGNNNLFSITYPGGRVVYHTHDGLNRLTGLWESYSGGSYSDPVAEYEYIGRGRVKTRTSGNGVVATYEYNGYDGYLEPGVPDKGFGNIATVEHKFGTTLLEGRMFTWDHAGNKTRHEDLRTAYQDRKTRLFDYDAANRLVESDTSHPSGSSLVDGVTTYTLDGVHNRTSVSVNSGGEDWAGAAIGSYTQDWANMRLNQHTTVPALPSSNQALQAYEYLYDKNGNVGAMVEYPRPADFNGDYIFDLSDMNDFITAFNDEDLSADLNGDLVVDLQDQNLWVSQVTNNTAPYENVFLGYDWRNQLVRFVRSDGASEAVNAEFRYDAFNRRVASLIDTDGANGVDTKTYFVYGGQAAWQLFEEYDDPDSLATLIKSYVYGNYIDEILQMRDHPSSDDYYYHQDDQFSVYAMTDDDGIGDLVVERYLYGDYGEYEVVDSLGSPRLSSSYGNRHAFSGRLADSETALGGGEHLTLYRHRYAFSGSGKFLSRDPLSYYDGMNLYAMVKSSPFVYLDPLGLAGDNGKKNRKCDDKKNKKKTWLDVHRRKGAYYKYTIICNGKVITKSGWTHDLDQLIQDISRSGCCVQSLDISTHHNPERGIYTNRDYGYCDTTPLENIKLCPGAKVDFNFCNGTGPAERLRDNNKGIPFEYIECTDGSCLHVPNDWWLVPGDNWSIPRWVPDGWDPGTDIRYRPE